MTNPDQVTLDEREAIVLWGIDNIEHWEDHAFEELCVGIKNLLDVIREVEEALVEGELYSEYIRWLASEGTDYGYTVCDHGGWPTKALEQIATADTETRLRAIYTTLRESGEI